jgi:hypothetical protein
MAEGTINWPEVEARHAKLLAWGAGEQYPAQFLEHLIKNRTNPRFGGVDMLRKIMAWDMDQMSADLDRLGAIRGKAGVDNSWVEKKITTIHKGWWPLADWDMARLGMLESKVSNVSGALTEAEYQEALEIGVLVAGRSPVYWRLRPGQANRIQLIINAAQTRTGLHQDDLAFMKSHFKTDMKNLASKPFKTGDLVWLRTGDVGMVLTDPYISRDAYAVAVDCMVNGTVLTLPLDRLRKRTPNKEKN